MTLGSKEGLANLAQAISSPGDVILAPNPSYPIHAFGFIIAGATIANIPPTAPDQFIRALEHAYRHSVPKPIALIVNYPSNPTAEVRDLDFYGEVVAFAKARDIYVLSDVAYAEIYFGDVKPPSILQVPGAREVAVEFGSLSKTYSMPGWRIGYAVGSKKLLAALARVKSYLDYGAFTPIQVAAVAALNGPQDCVEQYRQTYKRRRDVLIDGLNAAGWPVPLPEASMFAWARSGAFQIAGQPGILEAAARKGERRRGAGPGLRRAWRRPCPARPGREYRSYPSGVAQHP